MMIALKVINWITNPQIIQKIFSFHNKRCCSGNRRKMLPEQIKCILTFFDAFGYNSGSSHLSSKPKVIKFIKFLHISLAVLFTLCQFHIMVQYFHLLRWIEFFNTMMQFSVTLYTYLFITLDSLLQQQKHRHFWKTVQLVDGYFTCQNNFNFKCYILKCIEYFAVTIAFMVIIFGITKVN